MGYECLNREWLVPSLLQKSPTKPVEPSFAVSDLNQSFISEEPSKVEGYPPLRTTDYPPSLIGYPPSSTEHEQGRSQESR